MAEAFSNIGSAVLNQGGTLNNSTTTITVTSEVNVPTSGTFRALMNSEIIKVTNVSTHTWTISRGDGSSAAASHADGTTIYIVVTKEALDALVSIQAAGSETSNRRVLNFIGATVADNSGSSRCDITISSSGYDTAANRPAAGSVGKLYTPSDGYGLQVDNGSAFLSLTTSGLCTIPPLVTNWTWVNQGSASATDIPGGGIYLLSVTGSGDQNRMLVRTLSPPYTVTCGFKTWCADTNFVRTGMCIYDSSGGKLIQFCISVGRILRITHYNSTTSFNSDVYSQAFCNFPDVIWLRITDDNTNRKYWLSPDGVNWFQVFTHVTGTFLSPNRVGVSVNSNNTTIPSFMTLVSWKEA